MPADARLQRRTVEIAARCDRERQAAALREWAVLALTAAGTVVAVALAAFG